MTSTKVPSTTGVRHFRWRRVWVAAAIIASGLAGEPLKAATNDSAPFMQPLRIPPEYTRSNIAITMREACVQALPGPCTKMWTYDGMFPGPTIRRPSGKKTDVTFVNNLPKEVGSTTVHHHGNHSESKFDGQPDSYLIPPGGKFTYEYALMERGEPERAAFQWYHDHRMDVTGRNVWMGLAGMFILDDEFDTRLPLPNGKYDVPLMIVDRSFDENNQLDYKFNSIGNLGDRILVNGVVTPYFEVADRKYRFRLLNASNNREYRFELSNGQEMTQIAAESGLLPEPLFRKSIVLGPAERAEVVIDFAGHLGQDIVLKNTNPPIRTDQKPVPSQVMQFRVRRHASDPSRVPEVLRSPPEFEDPSETRVWVLGGVPGAGVIHHPDDAAPQHILWTINALPFKPDHVAAYPKLGDTERWIFVNNTTSQHRVHIHDVDWRIVARSGGQEMLTPGDPDAALSEAGLRETFLVQSGEKVEVISKFTDHPGRYLFHCHILEHEDNGMMAQFEVVGESQARVGEHSGDGSHGEGSGRTANHHGNAEGRHHAGDHSHSADKSDAPALLGGRLADRAVEGSLGGKPDSQMGMALAMLAVGAGAGVLALQRRRPLYSRLASVALALQLGGLSWDMVIHARAGEPLDLFENVGHLVAMVGIMLLVAVVALPFIPTRFLPPKRGTDTAARSESQDDRQGWEETRLMARRRQARISVR